MDYRALGRLAGLGRRSRLQQLRDATRRRRGRRRWSTRRLDAGITYFDTAESYGRGRSEEFLGEALAGRRTEAVIATKWGHTVSLADGERGGDPVQIRRRLEASLTPPAHRLRRPLPAPPSRSGHAARGDARMSRRTARRGQDPRDRLHPLHGRRTRRVTRRGGRTRCAVVPIGAEPLQPAHPRLRRRTGCSTRAATRDGVRARTSRSSRACSPASTGAARSGRRARGWPRGVIGPASSSTTTSWRRWSGCAWAGVTRAHAARPGPQLAHVESPRRLRHRRRHDPGPGRRQRRRRRMGAHPCRAGRHRHPPHPLT